MSGRESTLLGRYEILGEIGRGAMGLVYKASDPTLNRHVAIKTINLDLDQDDRAGYEARFAQEARSAGGLNHPNIVTIYDLGSASNLVYIAMEFLDGKDLSALIKTLHRLPIVAATQIALQLADALAHAHEKGIVHRDIKPANVMILREGRVKLTDFGIARLRSQESRTQTGFRMGSPLYMSPEQILGHRADPRSDIFSLGAVLYEMLTGRPPFSGSSLESIMYQTIHIAPTVPSRVRGEVPKILDLVVARMLEKDAESRYQTARALADDLRECWNFLTTSKVDCFGNPWQVEPLVDLLDLPPAEAVGMAPEEDAALPESVDQPHHPVRVEVAAGTTAMIVSREFDSMAATQKLLTDLSRPFDRPPVVSPGAPASRDGLRADPSRSLRPAPNASGWRLGRRERRWVVGILGVALVISVLILTI